MDTAPVLTSSQSLILDLPPSCLQFCHAFPSYFVVGTYNLQPKIEPDAELDGEANDDEGNIQSRNGSLLVFKLGGDEPSTMLSLIQTVSQPSALLDIRFNNEAKADKNILAAVSSTGTLAIFRLDDADKSVPLQHLATSRCNDLGEDVLFLQCKWHPVLSNVIAVTTSTGNARFLYLDDQWQISQYTDIKIPNTLEAWSIAVSPSLPRLETNSIETTVYCGGDDATLRYTTCSWMVGDTSTVLQEHYSPMSIKGKHNSGVTAILPLNIKVGNGGRVVVTGSYDEHLRVFLIHDLHESYGARRVHQVLEENLGGGVWRLDLVRLKKEEDTVQVTILASCMHAGARVVELRMKEDASWSLHITARFEEHNSMNYASDFSPTASKNITCVSSSFYDKLLCIWQYQVE